MVHEIAGYRVKPGEVILVDTNVWLFLEAVLIGFERKKQEAYSNFLNYARQNKGMLVTTAAVLSEVSNKLYFDQLNDFKADPKNAGKTDRKKDFPHSQQGKDYAATSASAMKNILTITQRYSDEFNVPAYGDYAMANLARCSFWDGYLMEFARRKGMTLLTDDGDIKTLHHPSVTVVSYRS